MHPQRYIQHLYLRAGFGLSPKAWSKQIRKSIPECVDELFSLPMAPDQLTYESAYAELTSAKFQDMDEKSKVELRQKDRKLVFQQNVDWLTRLGDEKSHPLLERMSLFWHGHFACITKASHLATNQVNAIRRHALGNFRDLVLAMAKDPSMIRFLNNQQNRKQQPNENFARELLELFTIGRGHYTERDIKEAARAFTGWSSTVRGEFVFRHRQHDSGQKTFMGRTGAFGGEDIIDIILEQKSTARFIANKIYRYFVNENISSEHVEAMSDYFYQNNYDIARLMRFVFTSDWFYHPRHIGSKVKSPVDLLAGLMKILDARFDNPLQILQVQRALGQVLFNPPNVAGWPGGRSWIDNSTLMLRLNLVNALVDIADVEFRGKDEFEARSRQKGLRKLKANINFTPLIENFRNVDRRELKELLAQYLLQTDIRFDNSLLDQFSPTQNKNDYCKLLTIRLMSCPEYQLC